MKRERYGQDLGEFLDRDVYPSLFSRLDTAFPEFEWKRKGSRWTASSDDHTRGLSGSPRAARVEAFENTPFGFKIHGGEFVSWISYLTDDGAPRGKDFVDAARDLAERAGVAFPEWTPSPEALERHKVTERHLGLLETFSAFAHGQLTGAAGSGARDYLAGRGFNEEELGDLELGFYPSVDAVKATLGKAGFGDEEITASGLLKDGRWEGRLVRPLRGPDGRIASYMARDLTGTAEDGAKYLYLAGHTKPPFVGLETALRSPEGRRHLLLVEGVLDVDHLRLRGSSNVAALGGAGNLLNVDRWKALQAAGVRSVTLAMDNDEPGREGLLRALENVHKVRNAPVVYVLDPGLLGEVKDPDEYVRTKGMDAFREALQEKAPGAVYYGRSLLAGVTAGSAEHEKREAVEAVLEYASGLRGDFAPRDREELLRLTAEATGFSFESLAEMDEERLSRRRREELERDLDGALRKAQADRDGGVSSSDVIRELSRGLDSLHGQVVEPPPAFSVDRILRESRETAEGRKSGWSPLDDLGVEFCPGELAILGARTGHGKTSILVNLMLQWLEENRDETFLFYSFEEPEIRIAHQLLSLITARADMTNGWTAPEIRDFLRASYGSRSNSYHWPTGRLEGAGGAVEILRSWEDRLRIIYRPEWTVEDLTAHARDLAEREAVGAVFVDYLQRIQPPSRGPGQARYDRRDMEISAIGRTLKKVSVDINVPVLAGAQINREAVPKDYQKDILKKSTFEEAKDVIKKARPDVSHLREGGSEQEADLILGLLNYAADYRTDETRDNAPDTTPLEVGVLKNRYGALGRWATLDFTGKFKLVEGR